MTYLETGDPDPRLTGYYPEWLDNLADDVTLEAGALEGAARGAEAVRAIVGAARELYEFQEFNYAGSHGDNGFLEDYTTAVRGEPVGVIVVVNHRPRSALLHFARLLGEKFAGTPLAKHWDLTSPGLASG